MQPLPRLRPLRSDLGIGALRPQLAAKRLAAKSRKIDPKPSSDKSESGRST